MRALPLALVVTTWSVMMEGLSDSIRAGLEIMAVRALGNEDDARDAVQETLARAVEAVRNERVPPAVPLAAFVHGVAKHVIADVLRRRMRDRAMDTAVDNLPAGNPSPLEQLVQREDRDRIAKALARLAPKDRTLLESCFVDGKRVVDIAEELGEPAERIRKRKSRALAQLRKILSMSPTRHVRGSNATLGA